MILSNRPGATPAHDKMAPPISTNIPLEPRTIEEAEAEGLRRAGRSVTGCIWEDCQLADPASLVMQGSPDEPTTELNPALYTINEGLLKLSKLVVIPDLLLSQYNDHSRTFMGLMTEIGRAWMSVDERLYLWDFKGIRDVTCWIGSETAGPIIDVRLVQPKKGVFVDTIKWLLVVVTPAEIRLLGVQFEEQNTSDLILHDTQLVFGTDQVNMLTTVGTRDGRIFCGGQDGHIYELEYESEEGWFTRRCRKINRTGSVMSRLAPTFLRPLTSSSTASSLALGQLRYDPSRSLLWSLTEGGRIDAYAIGNGSWSHYASFPHFIDDVRRIYPTMPRTSIGERLVSVHNVGREESKSLSLVAVTSSGLRLFYGSSSPTSRDLQLIAVKAPQPIVDLRAPSKSGSRSSKFNINYLAASMASIQASHYRSGLFVTAGALSETEDILMIRSARSYPSGSLKENSSEWRLDGKVWDIVEAGEDSHVAIRDDGMSMSDWWSELVQGHRVKPRQILCLTNAGIYVFEKERPVDTLSRLLTSNGGNVEAEAVQAFFQQHLPTDQAIAVALVLATRPTSSDVSFWATNAALRYGGEPGYSPQGDFLPSALQHGLFRVAARLLAPIWKIPAGQLDESTADVIVGQMRGLGKFMSVNAATIHRKPNPNVANSVAAHKNESETLQALEKLISRTSELLLFLAVCHDYRLDLSSLSTVDLELLASSPIRGPGMIRELGSALVERQLSLQASVESLCVVLRDRCPTFFSPADVLVYEGTDAVERALKHPSQQIRSILLEESLACFKRASDTMSTEGLLAVLAKYRQARFYRGILLLAQSRPALHEPALSCLEDLLAEDGASASAVLGEVLVSSEDFEFLESFYDWLFSHAIAGAVLLSQETTAAKQQHLIAYLDKRSFSEHGLASRAHADLWWKLLARQGHADKSGRLLLRLAQAKDEQGSLPLSDRLQYISTAITSLKACSPATATYEDSAEAQDILEVAMVQQELLSALQQRGSHVDPSLLGSLNSQLYDLTTLFTRFSEPLELPAVSLLIIHTAGHADAVLVSGLWHRLLTKQNAGDLAYIQQTLQSTAAKLYPSHVAFPLAYLVDMVALMACKSGQGEDRMVAWFWGVWRGTPVPASIVKEQLTAMLKAASSPSAASSSSFWAASPDHRHFLSLLLK